MSEMKAFPNEALEVQFGMGDRNGMNLRDYFAIRFAQAMYTSAYEWEPTGKPLDEESKAEQEELIRDAYIKADIMMRVRNEK